MKVLRSYRMLRFTLVLVAILAQCVALSSFSLLIIAGTLASISWYVTEGPRGRSIPPWVSRLLVFVVILFSVIDAFGPLSLLPLMLGRFVVWLTVIKLYGRRTIENEAQLLLLSLLLMAVGGLYATDFLFGILLILWTGLAAWVLLLYQLHHGVELMRMERYKAVPLEHPAPWTRPVMGLHVHNAFRRTASFILIVCIVSSLAFFLIMPRDATLAAPKFTIAHDDGSDRMELKPDRKIVMSNRQVMSVSLTDIDGQSVQLSQGLRLRGNVLDAYRGQGVWETGAHIRSSLVLSDTSMTPLTMAGDGQATLIMNVTLHQKVNRIYALHRPVGIRTDPPTRIVMNLANGTMGLSLGAKTMKQYQLEVDFEHIVVSPKTPQQHKYQNDAVKALAEEMLQKVSIDPEEVSTSSELGERAARVFESFLRSGDFTYATDGSSLSLSERLTLEQDEDPIATFLLDHRRGHCEYFAAAMVAMCDTVGIPARIVTGYYVDRWDAVSNSYIVLDRDAHAWVEVETEPLAWMPFDPTPASEEAPTWQESTSFAQSIRFAWQRWEMGWQANIIGFDVAAQRKILSIADPYWRSHWETIRNAVKKAADYIVGWFYIGAGGRLWIDLVAGAIVLSVCTVFIVLWRQRRTKKLLRLSHGIDEGVPVASVEFYARLQRVFAHQGWRRPQHIPTMTWIHSLPLEQEAGAIAIHLTSNYYAIRYGGVRPVRGQRLVFMQSVHQLDALLRKKTK